MDILAKLFGSTTRVRVMRLFLMNSEEIYEIADVAQRARTSAELARKEVRLLRDIGLVKDREAIKMIPKSSRAKAGDATELKKKKFVGYGLDSSFPFLASLRGLVTEIAMGKEDIAARFKGCGHFKLIVVAGIFIDEPTSRVDVLIVGDKLKRAAIERELKKLEAEVGKELTYALMESAEFEYRFGVYDKFVRDIVDYPHLVVLNKLNLF
jgi:uncharacterized protein YjiS (DUF1127 family)